VVVPRSLSETSVLLALASKTSCLSVLVDGIADPIDLGVTTDGFVGRAVGGSQVRFEE
jgi:hypothetical protein